MKTNATNYQSAEYLKLIEEINQSIVNFQKLGDKEKKEKNLEIIEKINYFSNSTDKVEDRRSKIQNFSYQYLAILLTVLGILFKVLKDFQDVDHFVIFLILCVQIFTTIIMIVWYDFQSSFRYPFLKIDDYSNQWKWFYYGNKYIPKINQLPLPLGQNKTKRSIDFYLKGLNLIINNYKEEDLNSDLKTNILQLYLLQVHNFYKNKFLLQLMNIRKWGFYVDIFIIVLYIAHKIIF